MEKLVTASELARRLNVHIHTIHRWTNSGALKCYRLGTRKDRRFSEKDIYTFLEKYYNPSFKLSSANGEAS